MTKQKTEEKQTEKVGLPEGVFDGEMEAQPQRKRKYDLVTLVQTLQDGKKYLLPSTVASKNTAFQIRKKVRETQGLETADFGLAKGTSQFVFYIPQKKN